MKQLDIRTPNPESRGRPPTGNIERKVMYALARDGTRWRNQHDTIHRAENVSWITRIDLLPEVQMTLKGEVVYIYDPAIRLHLPGSGFRFYYSGFKDPPERVGLYHYVRVEKFPNFDFQFFVFANLCVGKLITPGKRKIISRFRSHVFRSSRDWVNLTCTGDYLWKPDRDKYTSTTSAPFHSVWRMDYMDGLIVVNDLDPPEVIVDNCLDRIAIFDKLLINKQPE